MKNSSLLLLVLFALSGIFSGCADESLNGFPVPDTKSTAGYVPDGSENLPNDLLVPIARGEASSYQPGEGIERSFDGDRSTLYHSSWNNSGDHYFPITLTYYFENQDEIDYFVYYPRSSGPNGNFKVVEILTATEESPDFTTYKEINFRGSALPTRIKFDTPLMHPTAIRMIVKSGAGDGQGFASCAEMEFYRNNPDGFDPLTLFTDATCSELKPGVTQADIDACEYGFFRNIAASMLNDEYPREFRIQEYKPYPIPELISDPNKTGPYSQLDNPTGIAVAENEEVVILVGNTGSEILGLKIQNLDRPGGDGYNDGSSTYPLSAGMNKIKAANKGLLYILYNTENYETAAPVKIHIASGTVNGYFDITKHQAGEWTTRLSQATDKYFDVLGEYAHLTFPTERFRTYTPDGAALIGAYDDIVRLEQEFMGLKKYDRMNRNRMYLHVIYTSYMYATSYRTAFNDGTLNELCNVNLLKTGSIWGPAHEIGHVNQTRPGLKWLGTTEVTNNILSQYIQTTFGNESRIQSENLSGEGYTNRYEKAMTVTFPAGLAHCEIEDVFCKLVPFWQLQLYMSGVKGRTDFYADVYEAVRQKPNLPTAGEQQLEFVATCCETAGLDLTDFFSRWGFLKPVEKTIDDYGVGQMKITQAQVDALLARIAAAGYPKVQEHIEYLCDNSVDVFKANAGVQAGTAQRSGRALTMTGWKNVAAYEIYNGNDLIFVSTQPSFTVNRNWENSFRVYAVAVSGAKTEVTF